MSTQESFSFHRFHIDTADSPFLEELFEAKASLFQNCPRFANSLTLQSTQCYSRGMSRGIGYTQKSLSVYQCQQNSLPIFPVGFADNLHNAGIKYFAH